MCKVRKHELLWNIQAVEAVWYGCWYPKNMVPLTVRLEIEGGSQANEDLVGHARCLDFNQQAPNKCQGVSGRKASHN